MKKTLIFVVAIMLVLTLTFGLFACNKNKGNENGDNGNVADNGDKGNEAGNENGNSAKVDANVGELVYTQPTLGNLTNDDVAQVVAPLINKIANSFRDESDDEYNANNDTELLNGVRYVANKSGVDKAFLAKYVVVADSVWENAVSGVFSNMSESDSIADTLETAFTTENIQLVLSTLGNIVNEMDTNKMVSFVTTLLEVITTDIYADNNFDDAAIQAQLTSLGMTIEQVRNAEMTVINNALKSDDVFYLVNVGVAMLQNLSKYSAKELADTAQLAIKISDAAGEGGPMALFGSQDVSFKDMVDVANTAGRVVNTLMDAVGNNQQFGIALRNVATRYLLNDSELTAEAKAKIQALLSHPELIRSVGNLLANLSVEKVSGVYADFDDWSKKKKTAAGDKAFAVLVNSVVSLVKPEYDKMAADAKSALASFLGDATLVADVDALIAALPADISAITDAQVADINKKLGDMKKKIKLEFEAQPVTDKAYMLGYDYSVPFVVAPATIQKAEFVDLLQSLGYNWVRNNDYEQPDNGDYLPYYVDLTDKEFDFTVVGSNGKYYASLSGADIVTAQIELRADTTGLMVVAQNDSNVIRISTDDDADTIGRKGISSIGDRFSLLDTAANRSYRFEFSGVDAASFTGLGTNPGKYTVAVNVTTPFGLCKALRKAVVYDINNPQLEEISVSYQCVALNTTEEQFKQSLYVYASYDNGGSKSIKDGWTLSGFSAAARGDYKATITCEGKSTTLKYHVYDPENLVVTDISTDYNSTLEVGATLEDLNLRVYAIYDDGSYSSEPMASNLYTVTGFDTGKEGEIRVKVTYGKITRTLYLAVYDYSNAVVRRIYVDNCDNVYVGDDVSALNITLYVYYEGNYSSRQIDKGFTVEGFDSSESGWKEATVSYQGETCTLYYSVYERDAE